MTIPGDDGHTGPTRPVASGPVASGEADPVDPPPSGRRTLLTYAGALLIVLVVGFATFLILSGRPSTGGSTRPLPLGSGGQTPDGSAAIGPTQTADPHGTGPGGPPVGGPIAPGPTGGGPTTTAPAPAAAPVLTAAYSSSPRLLGVSGYVGQVHIANPGPQGADGWTVVITLPSSATFEGATGAVVAQNGNRLTFRPTAATRTIAGGSAVDVTFDVGGLLAGQPTGCSIDGRACG